MNKSRQYYWLIGADVFLDGTNVGEVVDIERNDDGSINTITTRDQTVESKMKPVRMSTTKRKAQWKQKFPSWGKK